MEGGGERGSPGLKVGLEEVGHLQSPGLCLLTSLELATDGAPEMPVLLPFKLK